MQLHNMAYTVHHKHYLELVGCIKHYPCPYQTVLRGIDSLSGEVTLSKLFCLPFKGEQILSFKSKPHFRRGLVCRKVKRKSQKLSMAGLINRVPVIQSVISLTSTLVVKMEWRSGLWDWCRGCMQMRGAVSMLVRGTVKWRSVYTRAQYSARFSSSLCLKPYHENSALGSPGRTSMPMKLSLLNHSRNVSGGYWLRKKQWKRRDWE